MKIVPIAFRLRKPSVALFRFRPKSSAMSPASSCESARGPWHAPQRAAPAPPRAGGASSLGFQLLFLKVVLRCSGYKRVTNITTVLRKVPWRLWLRAPERRPSCQSHAALIVLGCSRVTNAAATLVHARGSSAGRFGPGPGPLRPQLRVPGAQSAESALPDYQATSARVCDGGVPLPGGQRGPQPGRAPGPQRMAVP